MASRQRNVKEKCRPSVGAQGETRRTRGQAQNLKAMPRMLNLINQVVGRVSSKKEREACGIELEKGSREQGLKGRAQLRKLMSGLLQWPRRKQGGDSPRARAGQGLNTEEFEQRCLQRAQNYLGRRETKLQGPELPGSQGLNGNRMDSIVLWFLVRGGTDEFLLENCFLRAAFLERFVDSEMGAVE